MLFVGESNLLCERGKELAVSHVDRNFGENDVRLSTGVMLSSNDTDVVADTQQPDQMKSLLHDDARAETVVSDVKVTCDDEDVAGHRSTHSRMIHQPGRVARTGGEAELCQRPTPSDILEIIDESSSLRPPSSDDDGAATSARTPEMTRSARRRRCIVVDAGKSDLDGAFKIATHSCRDEKPTASAERLVPIASSEPGKNHRVTMQTRFSSVGRAGRIGKNAKSRWKRSPRCAVSTARQRQIGAGRDENSDVRNTAVRENQQRLVTPRDGDKARHMTPRSSDRLALTIPRSIAQRGRLVLSTPRRADKQRRTALRHEGRMGENNRCGTSRWQSVAGECSSNERRHCCAASSSRDAITFRHSDSVCGLIAGASCSPALKRNAKGETPLHRAAIKVIWLHSNSLVVLSLSTLMQST